jgi:CDGSH-type Zn-finger protein
MQQPACPQTAPYAVELEAGTYWWCACGRSKSQPFCDGSHKGTEFAPLKVEVSEAQKLWLCGCKQSSARPMCDGTHKRLAG